MLGKAGSKRQHYIITAAHSLADLNGNLDELTVLFGSTSSDCYIEKAEGTVSECLFAPEWDRGNPFGTEEYDYAACPIDCDTANQPPLSGENYGENLGDSMVAVSSANVGYPIMVPAGFATTPENVGCIPFSWHVIPDCLVCLGKGTFSLDEVYPATRSIVGIVSNNGGVTQNVAMDFVSGSDAVHNWAGTT